jgi:hypothetical protein
MLNLIQKITQISILIFLFAYPWYSDWWVSISIVANVLVTFLVVHSEFFHVFDTGSLNHWIISFKLFRSPKSVINLEDGDYRRYHIGIFKRLDESWDYSHIIIYKRFFPFWIAIYRKKVTIHDHTTIDKIQEKVKTSIKRYESDKKSAKEKRERIREERRKKVSTYTKLRRWDGLIGDDGEKKSYRREIRLSQILKKGKKTDDKITEE